MAARSAITPHRLACQLPRLSIVKNCINIGVTEHLSELLSPIAGAP